MRGLYTHDLRPKGHAALLLLRNFNTLWMDEILHHFETMGNHSLLVFT